MAVSNNIAMTMMMEEVLCCYAYDEECGGWKWLSCFAPIQHTTRTTDKQALLVGRSYKLLLAT
jgi:hypothetical protein